MKTLLLCLGWVSLCTAGVSNQTVLVSHTKSGRHWFEYSIRTLTGKRVQWLDPRYSPLKHQSSHPKSIWCSHGPSFSNFIDPETNRLILTLRNYKEVIARHTRNIKGQEHIDELLNPDRYKAYLKYVAFYDKWNEGTRHLYYYEDMMADPETELQKIVAFMDESDHKLKDFMESIEYHRKQSIKHTHAGSLSYGVPYFHTVDFPKDLLVKMDERMQELAGPLYDKYLKRFQESSL